MQQIGTRQRQIIATLTTAGGTLALLELQRRAPGSKRQLVKSLRLLEEVGAVQVARSRERLQAGDLVMLAPEPVRRDGHAVSASG